jgi:hypothetical protein
MNEKNESIRTPDIRFDAVCGLFCPACSVFIGTREDQGRLAEIAKRFQRPLEELQCNGCRSEQRCFYCDDMCTITKCAAAKGVTFCGECAEFPCMDLKTFKSEMPHRIELWRSHGRIKEVGYEKWYAEMLEHYSCKKCGTLNSAYDLACRKCGSTPSCAYVGLHKDEIIRHMAKWK